MIRKFEPEIKNHCTLEGVSRQKPAAIPKLTPSNQESLHARGRFQAKTCSDSQVWAQNQESMHRWGSGVLQAEPFSFVATDIRIGRGRSLPRRALQAGNSSLLRRWCCCDSQIDPFKSRITARWRAFPGKNLHRFASLGMKSRIDAAFGLFPEKTLQRFASLGMKSRIDAAFGLFPEKTLHRFPSLGLKSRIDARKRA